MCLEAALASGSAKVIMDLVGASMPLRITAVSRCCITANVCVCVCVSVRVCVLVCLCVGGCGCGCAGVCELCGVRCRCLA